MPNIPLKPGERIDDLMRSGLKIIQSDASFAFSMDAVLLAHFASLKRGDRVCDLGTGTGVIPLLLSARRDLGELVGVEIQEGVAEMAGRSIALNGLNELIRIVHLDLKLAPERLGANQFDLVVSNPPYAPRGGGIVNPDQPKAIARHEIHCTLSDILAVTKRLLKPQGRLAMVHRPARLAEIIVGMREVGIEPKRLRLVYPKLDQRPNMLLIEGLKGGRPEMIVEPPLVVYQQSGEYTPELLEVYFGGEPDE
ncbi:MAG: tRNA1(Val) (adenine(37)-N6)-methyltransferase [Bacillota bacterium]